MTTLKEWRNETGNSIDSAARLAGISGETWRRAERGFVLGKLAAKKILDATGVMVDARNYSTRPPSIEPNALLEIIERNPGVTRQDLVTLSGAGTSSVDRSLRLLLRDNLIVREIPPIGRCLLRHSAVYYYAAPSTGQPSEPTQLPSQQELTRARLFQEAHTAIKLLLLATERREPMPFDLGYLRVLEAAMDSMKNEVTK